MSYRAAWGKIKATEKNLGQKLVEMEPTGASLTKQGRKWLNAYLNTEDKISKEVISLTSELKKEIKK